MGETSRRDKRVRQQDLVWVQVPFSDLKRSKPRPALVLSQDQYNVSQEDMIVSAITSNLQNSAYKVKVDQTNLETGRLPIPSMIRADKIVSVEQDLVERSFARLDNVTYDEVVEKVGLLIKRPEAKPTP